MILGVIPARFASTRLMGKPLADIGGKPMLQHTWENAKKAVASIQKAKRLMDTKKISVHIFAEGTRSKTGEIQPFRRGAFYLASKVGYPIIPVTINGAASILPKGKLNIKGGTMHIHFDKPIPTGHLNTRQDEMDLMETVRNKVIENYLGVI